MTIHTTGIVFDIETRRHPKLREWLGTDEKVKRLEGKSIDELKEVAARHSIAITKMVNRDPIYNKIRNHFQDEYNKAALKMYGAEICSIAAKDVRGVYETLSFMEETGMMVADEPGYEPPTVWTVNDKCDERDIIMRFLSWLETYDQPTLMGFNIRGQAPGMKGFDIPMLRARCAMTRAPWPQWLPSTMAKDRYHESLFDVKDVFKDGGVDHWLRMAGLPMKTASGAAVQNMTPEELSVYNCSDVELERLLIGLVLPTQSPELQELAL